MTTYSSFFTLTGIEVLGYRHLLRLWRAHTEGQPDAPLTKHQIHEKEKLLRTIDMLEQSTYLANGDDAPEVKSMLRDYYVTYLKSAVGSIGASTIEDGEVIEDVLRKITTLQMSSTSR